MSESIPTRTWRVHRLQEATVIVSSQLPSHSQCFMAHLVQCRRFFRTFRKKNRYETSGGNMVATSEVSAFRFLRWTRESNPCQNIVHAPTGEAQSVDRRGATGTHDREKKGRKSSLDRGGAERIMERRHKPPASPSRGIPKLLGDKQINVPHGVAGCMPRLNLGFRCGGQRSWRARPPSAGHSEVFF